MCISACDAPCPSLLSPLQNDKRMKALFSDWKSFFGKKYATAAAEATGYANFKITMSEVVKVNLDGTRKVGDGRVAAVLLPSQLPAWLPSAPAPTTIWVLLVP